MRALKITGAIIAAVIVVIGIVLVIGIPSSFLTSMIEERVERESGLKLTISGGVKVGLWPSLNIALNDIALKDPKDREINNRLTAGRIQADISLASLWSGRPVIKELLVVRPTVNMPLQRVREASGPARSARSTSNANVTIEHVSISGGTLVASNVRDRVENRIETINADVTISDDRKIVVSGNARSSGEPMKFEIKATLPAPPIDRQSIPAELSFEAPAMLQGPLTAKAEVRLNGSMILFNGVSGVLNNDAFNGWASVDGGSKPLVKIDLDFQRLTVPMPKSSGGASPTSWSNASIDLNGMNYVDAQARISAAEIVVGDGRFAPAGIDLTLGNGALRLQMSNLGVYGGRANADLTIDASTANYIFALNADLAGARALPLLHSLADFDRLDGKLQAKLNLRSTGNSQRAIMANLSGTVFTYFQDGAIRGINVAQMIRSLTASTLSGWQESEAQATDLSQLSASFKVDKGQAQTTDLNLVGPLVRMTGAGTIDLNTKQIGFRVEPKLVMTTEGQGSAAANPVGFGIPVMISGPWVGPRIYPDMQGIFDNPDAAYSKLKEMGKGLFGPGGAGLGNLNLGSLLGGLQGNTGSNAPVGNNTGATPQTGTAANGQQNILGGQLGETIGNLLQQGMNGGLGNGLGGTPGQSTTPATPRQSRGIPMTSSAPATSTAPATAPATSSADQPAPPVAEQRTDQPDSQPMNDMLRQLFNR